MKLYNIMFITLGIFSMGIGMVGVIMPVLPTTPFLLLASYCFVRGSDKFDDWFKNTKIYKNYAEDFVNDRSMTLKRKISILLFADFMLLFPLIILESIYLKALIVLVILTKYYYFIFKIKTKK